MRLVGQPRIELLYKQNNLVIPVNKGDFNAVHSLLTDLGTIDPKKDYEVSISLKKKKRSLDANAYLWTLLGKLGSAVTPPLSKERVYQKYIKDFGVYQIVPIREDAILRWCVIWENQGLGWLCEDMGECKNTKGYHNILCYYGSSTYTTKEMSRLIDAVVEDCREMGIETLTPNELEELKQKWGAVRGKP
jgi:hypothetical protein